MARTAPTLAALLWLALATPATQEASAQIIRGVVVDSASQLAITGVLVVLTDSARQEVERRQVDTNGEFEFVALAPGWYSVRAERLGMTADTVERIVVAPGETVSLRMALAELSVAQLVAQVGRIVDLGAERPPPESVVAEGGQAGQTVGVVLTEGGGVIVGQVQVEDGVGLEPGGRVGLVSVGVAADLDSEGRFAIFGLPEGTYSLTYLRPSLGGLDWDYSLTDAVVRLGDTTTVSLHPPHPHQVLAQACGLEHWKPYTGVVEGQVLLPVSGEVAPGIRVEARWHESRSPDPRDLAGRAMTAVALTNWMGTFRFCGIPTDLTPVEVTAGERTTQVSANATLSDEKPVVKMTLRLPGA